MHYKNQTQKLFLHGLFSFFFFCQRHHHVNKRTWPCTAYSMIVEVPELVIKGKHKSFHTTYIPESIMSRKVSLLTFRDTEKCLLPQQGGWNFSDGYLLQSRRLFCAWRQYPKHINAIIQEIRKQHCPMLSCHYGSLETALSLVHSLS